jgi:hypothetical protein
MCREKAQTTEAVSEETAEWPRPRAKRKKPAAAQNWWKAMKTLNARMALKAPGARA